LSLAFALTSNVESIFPMKKLFIAALFISVTHLHAQEAAINLASLAWNEFYKLSWKDFKGQPTENAAGDAGTVVQIKAKPFMVKDKIQYDVQTFFDREKSWKRAEAPELLAHEQLHFDLAELYARKIRQKIAELQKAGVTDVKSYNLEVQKLLTESNEVDMKYDIETLHGALDKKQAEWADSIKKELSQLSKFKKPKRIIKSS
jgi:hypothetical protein